MSRHATPSIGIIAEDESDYYSIRILIHRISGNKHISMKKFVGKGCGKIKRKCNAWANQFKQKGCSILIIVHDLDNNDIVSLRDKIIQALAPNPIDKHLICIPIQEFEAWLLSDPDAIKKGMKLNKKPNIKGLPENIQSPKEFLARVIDTASKGEKIYNNTKHNEKIAIELSLEKAKKCTSFIPFWNFVRTHIN
jgi:Domain of unknown function (DUF4276)